MTDMANQHRSPPQRAAIAVWALAATGMQHTRYRPPVEPFDVETWRCLVAELNAQRLWQLAAPQFALGVWPVSGIQLQEAVEAEERSAAQTLLLDKQLAWVTDELLGWGVSYRVLKGPAHAGALWADPSRRHYSDLDILVPTAQFDHAASLIGTSLGGRRHAPDPIPGWTGKVGKGVTFTLPDGVELDLHRTIVRNPFGAGVLEDDLFSDPIAF